MNSYKMRVWIQPPCISNTRHDRLCLSRAQDEDAYIDINKEDAENIIKVLQEFVEKK